MRPYTVIDSDNYKAAGIDAFFFPGGEPHVKLPAQLPERMLLFLKLRTWNDVGLAAMLLDALQQFGIERKDFEVFIPYFPGARQDRSEGRTPLTAWLMGRLLSMWKRPVFFDPHSAVSEVQCWTHFMPADLDLTLPYYDGIIVPDKGAAGRAADMRRLIGKVPLIQCEKVRDFGTGHITSYEMPALPQAGRYLIVDDICDGGATFNLLADAFHSKCTGSELDLWVSHGIFSKGVSNIDKRISRIYTTDSWYRNDVVDVSQLRVKVFSLAPLFDKIMES